jgi:hypothetical protein
MHSTGKLDPHPEITHPRVKLSTHLTSGPVPAKVDWFSLVKYWPLLLNDRIGDCTAAGWFHLVQSWTAYAGTEFVPTNQNALELYEHWGYNPATGGGDNGAVEQDVLAYLAQHYVDGHGIVAFAQVDHTNAAEMRRALALFGGLYVGIQCPKSMQQQFEAGQVIDFVAGSPVEGGHCIVIVGWDDQYIYIVTWGKLCKMTWAFWAAYGDEAWVIVTKDFIEKNGMSPSGLNLQSLLDEFKVLGLVAYGPGPKHAKPHRPSLFRRILNDLRRFLRTL